MEHRLGRTLRVFLIVLAAAGFHRLTVVPLVEPRVHDEQQSLELSPEQAAAIRARADRRLAALGDIFPAGSWEREDPIMLESRQMRLLFKQYQALPDGRVNLVPCTLVILPDRNRVADDGSEGRTLVLRVPQGAVLEFDEPLDLRQGRLARLIGGSLRGQVTIRGTPSSPGADDDIEIVTRDVELEEFEVRTAEMDGRPEVVGHSWRGCCHAQGHRIRDPALAASTRSGSTATCGCDWRACRAGFCRGRSSRQLKPLVSQARPVTRHPCSSPVVVASV
jgi:hypothetical protein